MSDVRLSGDERELVALYRRLDEPDKQMVLRLANRLATGRQITLEAQRTSVGRSPRAVGLKEAARRVGIGHDHARHLVADGTFPIPELKRRSPHAHHKCSERDIDWYLENAATEDALPSRSRRR